MNVGIVLMTSSFLAALAILIDGGLQIKNFLTYSRRMRRNNKQAVESAKAWIQLDQEETRDQLIRDWKELRIPCSDENRKI